LTTSTSAKEWRDDASELFITANYLSSRLCALGGVLLRNHSDDVDEPIRRIKIAIDTAHRLPRQISDLAAAIDDLEDLTARRERNERR
jgi:hypothetical protein